MTTPAEKPLGHRSYGTIPHLPGSRKGEGDIEADSSLVKWCTEGLPEHSRLIVQEKLDGSNVGVVLLNGEVIPLIRAGYPAKEAHYEFLREFHYWAMGREDLWRKILNEGERICGEWLALAHGTLYNLPHIPFVAFDIMKGHTRLFYEEFVDRVGDLLPTPKVIHSDIKPLPIEDMKQKLYPSGHGAVGTIEGAVYRLERTRNSSGKPMRDVFLAKWVDPTKADGCYLPEVTGRDPIWNWREEEFP